MANKRRGGHDTSSFASPDCRIDFQNGVLICVDADRNIVTKQIVLAKSSKRKDQISLSDALRAANMVNTRIDTATLAFAPYYDPETKEMRIYIPAVVGQRLGFLYDDGGKFGFTAFATWGSTVYTPDINCNVVIDLVGQEIPSKEEFEKALNKLSWLSHLNERTKSA